MRQYLCVVSTTLAPPTADRGVAVRRARLLTNITIGYNMAEGVVAVVAGVVAEGAQDSTVAEGAQDSTRAGGA